MQQKNKEILTSLPLVWGNYRIQVYVSVIYVYTFK